MILCIRVFLLLWVSFFVFSFSYTQSNSDAAPSLKEQKILAEKQATNLPPLPKVKSSGVKKPDVPESLNIDSEQVIKIKKNVPNEGKPYFTISGGLAPFQVSLGILKYFIAEWWGQADLGVYFFPKTPMDNYYEAALLNNYNPYIGFKILSGWAFYSIKEFELSLFLKIQFAFISTTDVPIIFGGGVRFTYRFFWLDIGVSYGITAGGTQAPTFQGVQPYVILAFRF